MSKIAISFLDVKSSNVFSIVLNSVSTLVLGKDKRGVLVSTIRKFFFWSLLICPIPARRSPVTES